MSDTVLTIPISQIEVSDRLRIVDQAEVQKLAHSIKRVGQISPVEVRAIEAGRYRLVGGAHRIAAIEAAGLDKVRAVLFEGTDDQARMREIDENLYRHELSPFDQAEFLAERRKIWERLYGQVKRGGDRRSKSQTETLINTSVFIAETATLFNLSRSTINRAYARKHKISPDLWKMLAGTPAAKSATFLDRLVRMPVEQHSLVVKKITERGCSVEAAVDLVRSADRQKSPQKLTPKQALSALRKAWKATPAAERSIFLNEIKEQDEIP